MNYKKVTATILAASLLIPVAGQSFAYGSVNSQVESASIVNLRSLDSSSIEQLLDSPKENISFVKGNYGDSEIEYTYTSSGREWKAIEKTSSDFKKLNSDIYLKNDKGEYELFVNFEMDMVSRYKAEITITPQNGEEPLKEVIDNTPQQAGFEFINEQSSLSEDIETRNPSGLPISAWNHYGNFFYNTKIAKYTISYVTNIVVGLVGYSALGLAGAIVVSSTTELVAEIVKDKIPDIWYTDKVYYKTVVPPNPNMFRMKVAEKTTHTFYSDSGKTKHRKGSPITSEVWLDGYK